MKATWTIALLMAAGLHVAHASEIQVNFSNLTLSGNPGDTVPFFASLTNLSTTDTIYFNSISATGVSADLDFEILPFFLNAPLFLDPGESSGQFEIFDVAIDPAATPGDYPGNTISLLGGTDGGALDDLADSVMEVDVEGSQTTVPEPSGWILAASGVGLFVFRTRSVRTRLRRSKEIFGASPYSRRFAPSQSPTGVTGSQRKGTARASLVNSVGELTS